MSERLSLYLADDPNARRQPYEVHFDGPQIVRDGVRLRFGRNLRDEPVVQKIAVGGVPTEQLLAREARRGRGLYAAASKSYPRQLGRFIGDNPEAERPYTLFTCYGRTLSEIIAAEGALPFPPEALRRAVADLLAALAFLHTDRLVHGRLGLDTLRWDGEALQLGDFGHCVLEGEERVAPGPNPPWDAPRPAQERRALRADDVYAAGLVVFLLGTGEGLTDAQGLPESAAGMRARLALQDAVIRNLLSDRDRRTGRESDNAFADSPAARPDINTLVHRWRPPEQRPRQTAVREISAREAQAREDFSRLRERQYKFGVEYARRHPARVPMEPEADLPEPGFRLPEWATPGRVLTAFIVLIVVAIAAVVR